MTYVFKTLKVCSRDVEYNIGMIFFDSYKPWLVIVIFTGCIEHSDSFINKQSNLLVDKKQQQKLCKCMNACVCVCMFIEMYTIHKWIKYTFVKFINLSICLGTRVLM